MRGPHLYKSSLVIKIALATAILLIVYITMMFFNQMQGLGNSVQSMSVSNKRLLELEKILSVITTNESSVRSFIISRDSAYLKKRYSDKHVLGPQIIKLRKLSEQADQANFSCDTLEAMIDRRFILYSNALQASSDNDPFANQKLNFVLAQSDTLTDKIRNYIYKSLDAEVSNVNKYQIDHNHEIETSIITSFLLVTIALFILLLSLNRISSDLNELKVLNDELRFVNYTFNKAEKIAGISHWKYNLRTRKYNFSENFYHLLGVDPVTFDPSIETILPYIHHEDRETVLQTYTESIVNKTPTSLILRFIDKNGDIRYIRSVSSFTENSQGDLVKIGVNYDITEQYSNTVSLEENNRHLKVVNAELESFNNIVSHDLQEPLRKIQMFISRIDENEYEKLSENGRDYFQRIKVSANRMQNLMIDLVNYSRTMKGEKAFAVTDLREIIDDVINELSTNIEEKNAIISTFGLAEARVIPFQIHQLFVNLITNSLKFSREGVRPEITIVGEKVVEGELYDGIEFSEKFFKLIVSDNGIGFRQEFAERIFQLFRRLERQHEYRGTGIGLAICKKIVENHDGHIFAEGRENEGAKFIIYLPKNSEI